MPLDPWSIESHERWLHEMCDDYRLHADPHPVSMRAAINTLIHNQRARVAELESRLLNLVTAVELSSAVVVSQSVSETMADARAALAGKQPQERE